MIEIFRATLFEAFYSSEGEMINRRKQLELKYRDREMERFIAERIGKRHSQVKRRESLALRWRSFELKAVIFFKDLDCFIDFCLARYIVWRETRRERKGVGQD